MTDADPRPEPPAEAYEPDLEQGLHAGGKRDLLLRPGPARVTPPVSYEIEQALLTALLRDNEAFYAIDGELKPHHFADPVHNRIFESIVRLLDRGQQADAVTLGRFFEREKALADVGGAQYLVELQAGFTVPSAAGGYARDLVDLWVRRQIIEQCQDGIEAAQDLDMEIGARDALDRLQAQLEQIGEAGRPAGEGAVPLGEAATEALQAAEDDLKAIRRGEVIGLPTGLAALDKLMLMKPGDLIILAGRPGMGKSALATSITRLICEAAAAARRKDPAAAAGRKDQGVLFWSGEMTRQQIVNRLLADLLSIGLTDIERRTSKIDDDKTFERMFEATRAMRDWGMWIDDRPAITLPQLRADARKLKRQQGLALIVVDYMQLMGTASGERRENRVQEIGAISRGLKGLAKEMQVPVIALSQLSRKVEEREDKRPRLADLRETGDIEQDADLVLFCYREHYYLTMERPQQRAHEKADAFATRQGIHADRLRKSEERGEVIAGKQRQGAGGTAALAYIPRFTRWADLEDEDVPQGEIPF